MPARSYRIRNVPRSALVRTFVCVTVAAAVFASGCSGKKSGKKSGGGSSNASDVTRDLHELGLAYLNYHDAHKQGPPDWKSLIDASPKHADALKRLRDAGVTVKWNVRIRDAVQGASNFVLAETPGGGPKLMLDGSVQR